MRRASEVVFLTQIFSTPKSPIEILIREFPSYGEFPYRKSAFCPPQQAELRKRRKVASSSCGRHGTNLKVPYSADSAFRRFCEGGSATGSFFSSILLLFLPLSHPAGISDPRPNGDREEKGRARAGTGGWGGVEGS